MKQKKPSLAQGVRVRFRPKFRVVFLCVLMVLALLLSACGKRDDELLGLPDADSEFAFLTDAFPAVVAVYGVGGRGLCTGTVLSDKAVLTAHHCAKENGTYHVRGPGGMITASTVVRGPGDASVDDKSDIAILITDESATNISNGEKIKIARGIAHRQLLRLVGWGCGSDMDSFQTKRGSNKKREGTTYAIHVDGDFIETYTPKNGSANSRGLWGPKNYTALCNGDSGGPALVEDGGEWAVGATAHAGGDDDYFISQFVNLNLSENRGWLEQVNRDHNLGIGFIY